MRIVAVGSAFPKNFYRQEELLEAFRDAWAGQLFNKSRIDDLHRNVLVGSRYLALPIEEYRTRIDSWGAMEDESANTGSCAAGMRGIRFQTAQLARCPSRQDVEDGRASTFWKP